MTFSKKYTEGDSHKRHVWNVERIWDLANDLPEVEIDINQIVGIDSNTWFDEKHPPTIRAISEHARRIMEADLSYPPILTARNRVFDGMHRIARHLMEGTETIRVKKFDVDPEPDKVLILDK